MAPSDRAFNDRYPTTNYWPPERFTTITDLRVDPLFTESFGVQMVWRSAGNGVIMAFPWWDNLERNAKIADPTWWPVGTGAEHFFDADQEWAFECWADDAFVYVINGLDYGRSPQRRFRVPRDASVLPGVEASAGSKRQDRLRRSKTMATHSGRDSS